MKVLCSVYSGSYKLLDVQFHLGVKWDSILLYGMSWILDCPHFRGSTVAPPTPQPPRLLLASQLATMYNGTPHKGHPWRETPLYKATLLSPKCTLLV